MKQATIKHIGRDRNDPSRFHRKVLCRSIQRDGYRLPPTKSSESGSEPIGRSTITLRRKVFECTNWQGANAHRT